MTTERLQRLTVDLETLVPYNSGKPGPFSRLAAKHVGCLFSSPAAKHQSDQTQTAQLTNMSLGQSPLLSLPNLTSHAKVVAMYRLRKAATISHCLVFDGFMLHHCSGHATTCWRVSRSTGQCHFVQVASGSRRQPNRSPQIVFIKLGS